MLFEIANTYLDRRGGLPLEEPKLGAIFHGYQFRAAKGVLEALMDKLHINFKLQIKSNQYLLPGKSTSVIANAKTLGVFGINKDCIFFELDVTTLFALYKPSLTYKPVAKYPPQIEDLTIRLKGQVFLGEVIENLKKQSKKVTKIELIDEYQESFTLRIYYQDPQKTLTDREVQMERQKLLKYINKHPSLTAL